MLRRAAEERGLYSPSFERDACGMSFIARHKGEQSHSIDPATRSRYSTTMSHRGACVRLRPRRGDSSGHPHADPARALQRALRGSSASSCPKPGRVTRWASYFLPRDAMKKQAKARAIIERMLSSREKQNAPRLPARSRSIARRVRLARAGIDARLRAGVRRRARRPRPRSLVRAQAFVFDRPPSASRTKPKRSSCPRPTLASTSARGAAASESSTKAWSSPSASRCFTRT